MRRDRELIDPDFRADLRNRSLFMEIMRQTEGVTHELRRMNRYGILAAYLPEFGKIVGQMQHDLFHVYTVDEHTLMVIRNLRRLTVPEFRHEFPFCSELIQTIPKQELLLIAALYHDIAKGRGGDHARLGAVDAEAFCRRHGLSDYDTHLVTWLVRNHLLMSSVAQRQDISDPDTVHAFAEQVGEKNRLDYLYLLTIADIRGTSDKVWNDWKGALLKQLYDATRDTFRRAQTVSTSSGPNASGNCLATNTCCVSSPRKSPGRPRPSCHTVAPGNRWYWFGTRHAVAAAMSSSTCPASRNCFCAPPE